MLYGDTDTGRRGMGSCVTFQRWCMPELYGDGGTREEALACRWVTWRKRWSFSLSLRRVPNVSSMKLEGIQ